MTAAYLTPARHGQAWAATEDGRYTETHRAQQDGFHRVYFRNRLDS